MKPVIFWIVLAVVVATPFVLLRRWLKPPDEVEVTIQNIDPSTRMLCLVADTPAGPEAMWWSLHKVGPFSMHPNDCTVSMFNPKHDGMRAIRRALWRDGKRYGVLTQDANDNWLVFWFSPEEVHLRGRYWVIGGGEAAIELPPKDRAERASEEMLDQVGFDPGVRKEWRGYLGDP
jgi:hypothetical protein